MPATPLCGGNCDTRRASGNCLRNTKNRSIRISLESSQPGDPRCVPHVPSVLGCSWLAAWVPFPAPSEQVFVIWRVDHPLS
eukprot:5349416-Amphidinium_carterae.1